MTSPITTELTVLGWSFVLFLAHLMVQATAALKDQGAAFNAGPRDTPPPLGVLAGRAQRTFANFKETYPIFIALVLALAVTGRSGGMAATGAWIWLGGCGAAIDARGFILTGRAARPDETDPPALMTSLDGVFAIGDVRSGSTKRVAAAVGEGAAVVAQIHAYLADHAAAALQPGAAA